MPEDLLEMDDDWDDELDEIPIEEVIGIGERMHPERKESIRQKYEEALKFKDRLISRRGRAINTMNVDLQNLLTEKIGKVYRDINDLRKAVYGQERIREESAGEGLFDGVFETTRPERHEEPIRLTTETQTQEVQEEEHDEIDELAIVLGFIEEE